MEMGVCVGRGGVETMEGGWSSGRRAAYKDGAGVLWCARSTCRLSASRTCWIRAPG